MQEDTFPEDGSLAGDPLSGDPRLAAFFGERFGAVSAYALLLAEKGVERGLIGPREAARLWERHLLNSAAIVPFLRGSVADIGSGAGLPGLVIAAMEPEREVTLVEPMERRVAWLREAVGTLGLSRVRIVRARAEELRGRLVADSVVARAVAPIVKLVPWCAPLMSEGGQMLFLKGRSAEEEILAASTVLRRGGWAAEVVPAATIVGIEETRVVRIRHADAVGRDERDRLES